MALGKLSNSKAGRDLRKVKFDIVKDVSLITNVSQKDVRDVVDAVFITMHHYLATGKVGTRVTISGFGTFIVQERSERTFKNMKWYPNMFSRARRRISFKPSAKLKEYLKKLDPDF